MYFSWFRVRQGWNMLGIAWFAAGCIAGLLAYEIASRFMPNLDSAKAVSWLVWGCTIVAEDIAFRIAKCQSIGKGAVIATSCGGVGCLLPIWGIGFLIIAASTCLFWTPGK